MLKTIVIALGFSALLLPTLRSQTCFYSFTSDPLQSTLQPVAEPLGQSDSQPPNPTRITQFFVSRFRFQNAPVHITGLAFSMTLDGSMSYSTIRVRMAHTAADSLNTVFANNFTTPPQVVLETHDYAWPHRRDQWAEVGLQTPFLYTPGIGNLLIEIRTSGMVSSNAGGAAGIGARCRVEANSQPAQTILSEFQGPDPIAGGPLNHAPLVRVCAELADLSWLGISCPGSAGTRPVLGFSGSSQLGATVGIVLSNALPARFTILAFGWDAPLPFPVSLTPLGMPNCWQYFSPTNTVGLTTDGVGTAAHLLSIPSQASLAGLILFSQFFVADASANAAGIVSTNFGRIQPGL